MEELNKYLSRLSEHHDMYVLSCVLVLRISRVTDGYLGLRLDRVRLRLSVVNAVYDTSPMQCYRSSGIFIDPSRPANKK